MGCCNCNQRSEKQDQNLPQRVLKDDKYKEQIQNIVQNQSPAKKPIKLNKSFNSYGKEESEKDMSTTQSVEDFTFEDFDIIGNIDKLDNLQFEEQIQQNKMKSMQQNQLVKIFTKVNREKPEKPMNIANLWKLFENLMDKKFEQDEKDRKSSVQSISIQHFMFDYLTQQYGSRSLATKVLSQCLLSLSELNQKGHMYGNLFCRLLQVYHPEPIDNILASFLVKVWNQFNKARENYLASTQILQSRRQRQQSKAPEQNQEDLEMGGQIPLVDIFGLISKNFESDQRLESSIIQALCPSGQVENEYAILVLSYKIKKSEKSSQEIFKNVDKENQGEMQIKEIINLIKTNKEPVLDEKQLNDFSDFLNQDMSGTLTEEQFTQKIQILNQKYCEKEKWMSSKAQLLTAICDEYEKKRIQDYHYLQNTFLSHDFGNGPLDYQKFEQFCFQLDQSIQQTQINEVFTSSQKLAKDKGQNEITSDIFALVAWKVNIGRFGTKLFSIFLIQVLMRKIFKKYQKIQKI